MWHVANANKQLFLREWNPRLQMEKIRFNKIPIWNKFGIYQLNFGLLNALAILLVVLESPFLLMLSLISRRGSGLPTFVWNLGLRMHFQIFY